MSRNDQPPKPYSEVRSEFIKQKIRETDFEDSEKKSYIHALIWLEKTVLEKRPAGYPTGIMLSKIQEEYRKELQIIRRELKPETVKKSITEGFVEAVEESLEPSYELEKIIERLDNREGWRRIKKQAA